MDGSDASNATTLDCQNGGNVPAPHDTGDTSNVTILVTEDDPWMQELIGAKLRTHRYRVIEAASGGDALLLLRTGGVDVLVTDIAMPGALDGWALGQQARLVHPTIAVVYVSSRPADAARQVSHSLYLQKPFLPDAIIAAIRHLTS
jgi:two-component system, response regulator PdtaR